MRNKQKIVLTVEELENIMYAISDFPDTKTYTITKKSNGIGSIVKVKFDCPAISKKVDACPDMSSELVITVTGVGNW